jgi:two-component system response regulator HydG
MKHRILIVDDEEALCRALEGDLRRRGFDAFYRTSGARALETIRTEPIDVVVTDLNMPGMTGLELCERVVANRPDLPVIVLTAFGSLETAVGAIRAGAYDFVNKPVETDVLAIAIERAARHRDLQEQVRVLSEAVDRTQRFEEILGASPRMRRLYEDLDRVAATDSTVLLCGESGTGKELVARALHRRSARAGKPFVAVDCTSLPESLLESELYGHKGGAYTGAQAARKGLFLEADGGTILLDEIGDFPISQQPKLLRALEERTIRPVGSDKEVAFDVRILAATNRDLESAVEEGRFREDLYFRINVIPIEVPPLRARGADILLIAQHYIEQFAAQTGKAIQGLSEAAAERLLDYSWPGNVRELRNAMERAVALTRVERIAVDDLPEKIRAYRSDQIVFGGTDPQDLLPLEVIERRYIEAVLRAVGGNRSQAARILGLDRKTLYRKLKRFGDDVGSETG